MSIHINSLPDLCLLMIFGFLAVRDLLNTGRVCTKWLKFRQIAGLKVRTLTLVVGGIMTDDYPLFTLPNLYHNRILNEDGSIQYPKRNRPSWDSVHYSRFNLNALIGLTVTFPNVNSLEVAFQMRSKYQLCAPIILIRLWQHKLIALKLHIVYYDGQEYRDNYRQIPTQLSGLLMEAINSLSVLKSLSLQFIDTHFTSAHAEFQLDLPILARLDRFEFISYDSSDVLFHALSNNAITNPRLRLQYELDRQQWSAELVPYYSLGQEFCSKFERIFCLYLFSINDFETFCLNFSSITTVFLYIDFPILISNMLVHLSQLTQLVHLQLNIDLRNGEGVDDDDAGEDVDVEGGEENEYPVLLARLPSVKSFQLTAFTFSHNNLALFNVPWTMANLQIIDVTIDVPNVGAHRCDDCGLNAEGNEQIVTIDQVQNCLANMMLPLRECTRLHTISFNTLFERDNDDDAHDIILEDLTIHDLSRPLNFDF